MGKKENTTKAYNLASLRKMFIAAALEDLELARKETHCFVTDTSVGVITISCYSVVHHGTFEDMGKCFEIRFDDIPDPKVFMEADLNAAAEYLAEFYTIEL